MGRHILAALLGGLLVVGVTTAFAEEPQLTDQEILKAWGQTQVEVEPISEATRHERTRGLKPLTDEELEHTVAGMGAPPFQQGALSHIPSVGQAALGAHYPGPCVKCPSY